MKSIRIGNDIRIEWPIVLSGDVSKLQDLDLTVEVRPSAKIIDTHNYADAPKPRKVTVMMNGGITCRPDIGDGKEHCRPRPCPPHNHRPVPPAPVRLPYHIEDNTLIAMWTADRQFATGDYDIILYAHKNEGGQAVCDQYRFVRLVSHTAEADAPDDSGIEAVIAMQPVTLELSGLSAYEVAVVNGFQGTEEEWLQSLKQPAIDAAEQAKEDIEQFKTETKAELKEDIEALGYYEDNPEFIRVYTDAEGKFLWGIRIDGSIEWAKGVPTPVQNALKELADKIKDLGGDKIEEVETALNEKIEALQDAIDVINALMKPLTDTFSYQDNEEFAHVITDAEGKVLFGIKVDGSPYYPNNEMYHVIQNEEYLAAWVDANNKILFGIKTDGSIYIAKSEYIDAVKEIQEKIASLSDSVQPLTETFQTTDNPEFMAVTADSEGKVLEGTLPNGKKYFPMQELLDKYDDVEGRTEMTLDAEDRVLAYRDKEGIKHEEKLALHEVYDKNNNKINLATKEDVENVTVDPSSINISELKGVSDHNTPNLLIADEMQKTFNDGTNSFTPPNEGYEMSNPIECQAGDWFTRTGTATGMVVVTDEDDKNGTRLFNADGTTLGNTFQIPEDMTWVKYIRMAAEVGGAEDGSVVICKGKEAYIGENRGNYLTISELRVEKRNLSKDVMYVKSEDGTKFYELYVDSSGTLKAREIDPDIIPESEYPVNWIPFTLTGSFEGYFDRMCIQNNRCLIELKATGPTKIKSIGYSPNSSYGNFEHFYTKTGEDRYVMNFSHNDSNTLTAGKRLTIYDGEFNIIEQNINGGDIHDFAYINDEDIIIINSISTNVNVPGYGEIYAESAVTVSELKKVNGSWATVAIFKSSDYPKLLTDGFGIYPNTELDNSPYENSHQNTVGLDYDGNIIVNCRNWDTWIKIRRVENADGTVTIGSKTLDYDEAIIGRVGGRHNSGYLDSKRVLNDGFSFTDTPAALNEVSDDAWEEWQWFHSHDVKYWGMKQIGDKQYPTYTLFDNNYWSNGGYVVGNNMENKNNNIKINPQGDGNYYLTSKDGNESYAKYQHSRVIQISIDWENHKVMDYRVYYIPKMYSREQGGATMYDEGIISISYSYAGEFGLWDFTTGETEVSGHNYKGAKELFHGKYENYKICYRANTYKINV